MQQLAAKGARGAGGALAKMNEALGNVFLNLGGTFDGLATTVAALVLPRTDSPVDVRVSALQ